MNFKKVMKRAKKWFLKSMKKNRAQPCWVKLVKFAAVVIILVIIFILWG